ncbi:hypothetical protein [Streptomyces aurantiogriseus]|uniref:Uncharacterized protein n=1 Tax=Streptomyces aurantiogriseus TaxID=66870 RepID=A0A918CI50_9ACTN|nr:hypothetical protein [Streptomyces aurantiogriseus]GGR24038.1 hypothetical protein GCM10010251_45140 [Streptomyces aurantiogriseus]
MSSPTVTLDHLIQTRLAEIAEDAWRDHRIMPVRDSDGRVLQLGTAAVRERWTCMADHGYGLCNEPLLTHQQASTLMGMFNDDEPIPNPLIPPVEVGLLDPGVGGFLPDSLYHFSDVVAEYRKAQG